MAQVLSEAESQLQAQASRKIDIQSSGGWKAHGNADLSSAAATDQQDQSAITLRGVTLLTTL